MWRVPLIRRFVGACRTSAGRSPGRATGTPARSTATGRCCARAADSSRSGVETSSASAKRAASARIRLWRSGMQNGSHSVHVARVGGAHVLAVAHVASVVVEHHARAERAIERQVGIVRRNQRAAEVEVVDVVASRVTQERLQIAEVARKRRPVVVAERLVRRVLGEARIVGERVRLHARVAQRLREDRSLSGDLGRRVQHPHRALPSGFGLPHHGQVQVRGAGRGTSSTACSPHARHTCVTRRSTGARPGDARPVFSNVRT